MKKFILPITGGLRVLVSLLPAFGAVAGTQASANVGGDDARAWSSVIEQPTVESYVNFILSYPESRHTDEAFCALYQLDQGQANSARDSVMRDYAGGLVDLSPCASSASARLINI